jgi:hypothetical protein
MASSRSVLLQAACTKPNDQTSANVLHVSHTVHVELSLLHPIKVLSCAIPFVMMMLALAASHGINQYTYIQLLNCKDQMQHD